MDNNVSVLTIISSHAFPASTATANRVEFLLSTFLKYSDNSRVQIIAGQSDKTKRKVLLEGSQVNFLKIKRPKNILIRGLHEFFLIFEIKRLIDNVSHFQIYTVPSPLILMVVYIQKSNQFGIDVRDCTWDYLSNRGWRGVILARLLKLLINPVFRRAKFITCTNKVEASSILRNFNREATIIPNGISENKFNILSKIQAREKSSKPTLVLYTGNIGYAQALMTLVKVAHEETTLNFRIIGEGVQKDEITNYIERENINNVFLEPAVSWDDLIIEYQNSDILYAQITAEFDSAIPTKIFEYVATGGKVVLGLPNGPAKSIFKDFSGVFIHEPENVEDCLEKLNLAINSEQPDRRLNERLLSKFIRETHGATLFSLIEKYM